MNTLITRMKNLFRKSAIDHDLDAELSSHLQLHIDDNLKNGMSPEQSRKDALLKLGGLEQTKESMRDVHLLPWLDTLRSDAVFGFRQLAKNKITSFAAILSLALAIGACTSAFRLIDAIFLRPLPVAHADHLFYLSRSALNGQGQFQDFDGWAYPDFTLMRDAAKGQAQLFAVSYEERTDLTYKSDQEMEKAHINYVSGDMFSAFGLKPALGRLLAPQDDVTPGAHPVAVISYDYWTRRFQNDPKVLGKTFRYGKNIFQIIGVCDPPYTGVEPGIMSDIFIPTMMHHSVTRGDSTWHRTFAIVQPGVNIEPLRAKLDSINRTFETERSKTWANEPPEEVARYLNQTLLFHSASAGASNFQQDFRSSLYTIAVLVFFVLLIACVNVANLLFAQAASRAREMALRISIGAGRRQLIQLVLVESGILALVSAVLGAFFAAWSAPYVLSLLNGDSDNPTRLSMPADYRIFFFIVALTAVVTCLFGIFPALRASSTQPVSALKGGEDLHSRRRLMYVLIGAQVAFCCLVLFMAGLFVTTFNRLSHQPVGFNTNGLLILDTVSQTPIPPSAWMQVADQLRNIPGVERASVSNGALMMGYSNNNSISINGGPPSRTVAHFRNISPGWIATHQITLLSGRDFLPSEITPVAGEGTPATGMNGAAIVNQTFVDTFFPNQNVIGKSFDELLPEKQRAHFTIVGLTKDATYRGIREKPLPVAYLPFNTTDPNPWWSADGATFIVRTSLDNPLALSATLRSAIQQLRPGLRVSNVTSQNELVQGQTTRERFLATLASFFAAVALLLAAIGLYGVLHYSVIQRRREIAIRLAIGAQAPGIARLVSLPLFAMISVGAVAGIIAGIFAAHYLADLFFQVRSTDALILAFPTVAIFLAAIIAATPAVLRAIHTDPASTLRSE